MKKKWLKMFAITMAVLMALCLGACGGGGDSDKDKGTDKNDSKKPDKASSGVILDFTKNVYYWESDDSQMDLKVKIPNTDYDIVLEDGIIKVDGQETTAIGLRLYTNDEKNRQVGNIKEIPGKNVYYAAVLDDKTQTKDGAVTVVYSFGDDEKTAKTILTTYDPETGYFMGWSKDGTVKLNLSFGWEPLDGIVTDYSDQKLTVGDKVYTLEENNTLTESK